MRTTAAILLAGGGMLFGAWQYVDARYLRVSQALLLEARLEFAQVSSAAELQADIEAIRLANIVTEVAAIDARGDALRPLPGDTARRAQLLARMVAIIENQEK